MLCTYVEKYRCSNDSVWVGMRLGILLLCELLEFLNIYTCYFWLEKNKINFVKTGSDAVNNC